MANLKTRLEKLEASAPAPLSLQITEIHRVLVGRFNGDGSPVTIVRRIPAR